MILYNYIANYIKYYKHNNYNIFTTCVSIYKMYKIISNHIVSKKL